MAFLAVPDADTPYVRKSFRKCVRVALAPNTLAHVYSLCIRNNFTLFFFIKIFTLKYAYCKSCVSDLFRAHRGLPVGFLLPRYSVLFTVESLSLLYLPVIS